MNNAVTFRNVSFAYTGGKPVIENTGFELNYGEIALLAGASGEGKSTVLSLTAGIIPNLTPGELSGEILINGKSIAGRPLREICREVGVVLQNADSQIIQQSVEDEIAFGCENFNFDPEAIKEQIAYSCNIMSLEPQWKTRTLSGGQKQRLITACALATKQKILLLDEPLANLDTAGADLLMRSLKELAADGYAVLIIEHRADAVMKYADRVWIISDKKISPVYDTEDYMKSRAEIITDICNASTSDEVLFSLENVSYKAGGRQIINNLNLEIKKGERLLILGENGCGKTTLMRLLASLSKPTDGEINQNILPGLKKSKTNKEWFRKVGVVYQNPNYQLFMPTVRDEIHYNAFSPEYADEMIKLFGFESLTERHPQSLSEGQKRRLTIAAVLAGRPDVLLLDEPTVGQDYDGLRKMTDLLNRIHTETGNTMIAVTHDKRCAEALCDRSVILEDGRVSQTGGKELANKFLFNYRNRKD